MQLNANELMQLMFDEFGKLSNLKSLKSVKVNYY